MTRAGTPRRAMIFWSFAAIYGVWGSTYLAIRILVAAMPPLLAGGARFVLAGSMLYGWARWRGVPSPDRRLWGPAFLLGALFFLLGNGGVSWAETRIPSGLTALLAAVSPLFTVVFQSKRGGWRRPPARVILGITAGLGGVALLVAPGEIIGGGHADLLGAAAITVAAIAWAGGSVLSHAVPLHQSPSLATGMKMLAGGVLLLLAGLAMGEGARVSMAIFQPKAILAWFYLVIFGSIIGFSAFTYLLRVTTPEKVSTSAYVNPLVAVTLGWALLGESVSPRTMVAAAIIIGGVALIRLGRGDEQPVEAAEP
ncbi:MAG TPA: EamA family transporter [Gemmatimonadales bacterium]|nr:EamA family transporter [Gemmatimonadales bacterium]